MSDDVPMVPTVINGKWTITLPSHRAERAEWATGWEVERVQSMHDNLKPGMVLYDVGTEEGDLSALYGTFVAGHADYEQSSLRGGVVLMEPNHRVWPNVRAIWDANPLDPPIGCWQGFASDTTTAGSYITGEWPQCAYGPIISDHGFQSLAESEAAIPSITLDEVAHQTHRPPDAITMDVEGAELRVLRGAHHVLVTNRPLVWVSVHPLMIQYDYRQVSDDVHRYMADCGYRMHQLAMDHEVHMFYWPKEREVVLP